MRFRTIVSLNLIGMALIGVAEGSGPPQSGDIHKRLIQFRGGRETEDALMVQRRFNKAPTFELADSSTFGMSTASTGTTAAQKSENRSDPNYELHKLEEWRAAAVQHNPGKADPAAVTISNWDNRDLELVVKFITKLASQSVKNARRTLARASTRRILQLTDQEVRRGDLNRILKQGALLHTDIALLELEAEGPLNSGASIIANYDGRLVVLRRQLHWEFARRLINSVSPSPSEDPMVRQWYIATTAHMQSRRLFAYAKQNLEDALEIFPSDDRILFYAGVLHETWASPLNQNVQLPPRGESIYGSKESELKRARQFFQKSIEANPNSPETHLRFGRVLGLLGNHTQAVAELQLAASSIKDPQLLYYTSLYLGCEYATLSRRSEAREQYERAAMLYPTAQSPLFALSQLAQSSADIEGAFLAIQRVFELQRTDSWNDDPWWIYDLSHVRNADALAEEMRAIFGGLQR